MAKVAIQTLFVKLTSSTSICWPSTSMNSFSESLPIRVPPKKLTKFTLRIVELNLEIGLRKVPEAPAAAESYSDLDVDMDPTELVATPKNPFGKSLWLLSADSFEEGGEGARFTGCMWV